MTDKKNLHIIISEANKTLQLAEKRDVDAHPTLDRKIMRVAGNIRSIRVEVHRLKRVKA
jgi:hypothetical protein